MKKKLSLIICIVILSSLFSACGEKNEEVSEVREPGILKVGIVNGNDRYARVEDGSTVGIEAGIAEIVAQNSEYELQITLVENEQALFTGMMNGKYDLGFGRITDNDGRMANLDISSYYGRGGLFLLTPRYNYMDCITTVPTGTIGISQQAGGLSDEVDGIETANTELYPDISSIADDINSGVISAALVSEREAVKMINDELQAQALVNSPRERYVALLPNGSPLRSKVNSAISEYRLGKFEEE